MILESNKRIYYNILLKIIKTKTKNQQSLMMKVFEQIKAFFIRHFDLFEKYEST